MPENTIPEITPESGLSSRALFGWWFVRVQLRREDKSLQWVTRAAFKNQGEAELYRREWDGIARTEVFQPNTQARPPQVG